MPESDDCHHPDETKVSLPFGGFLCFRCVHEQDCLNVKGRTYCGYECLDCGLCTKGGHSRHKAPHCSCAAKDALRDQELDDVLALLRTMAGDENGDDAWPISEAIIELERRAHRKK